MSRSLILYILSRWWKTNHLTTLFVILVLFHKFSRRKKKFKNNFKKKKQIWRQLIITQVWGATVSFKCIYIYISDIHIHRDEREREISIINVVNNYKRKKFLKKNISCDFERRESLNNIEVVRWGNNLSSS